MKLLLFFGIAVLGIQKTASKALPWTDPCGGSNVVPGTEGQGGIRGTTNVSEALDNIASSSNETAFLARSLMAKYDSGTSTTHITPNVRGHSPILTFPAIQRNTSDVNTALQSDYDDVSTIIVYMDEVVKDEAASDTAISYANDTAEMKSSLYSTLCKIKMAADANGLSLVYNITREVMPDSLRNIVDISVRHTRDYLIIRDAESYLKDLATGY